MNPHLISLPSSAPSLARFRWPATRHRQRGRGLAAVAALALLLGASLAQAATITVLNNDNSGIGSMRAAIAAAAAAGDTIVFDAALNGQTIVLTGGALFITNNLTITGPGADKLAVSGNNASEVFHVAPGAVANLAGLTVRNGFRGVIFNNVGTKTVANSTISGNQAGSAGGIYNSGTETLNNSIVAGNFTGAAGSTASDIGGGTVDTASHKLIGDAGSAGDILNGVNGNLVGAAIATVLNPTLASNGGPTLTHALVTGSPALDAGDNTLIPPDFADQNGNANTSEPSPDDQCGPGFARVAGSAVDIGALESPFVNGEVTGRLYLDTNGNSTQDGLEPRLTNVLVYATNHVGATVVAVTDANGDWTATVPPGVTVAKVDTADPNFLAQVAPVYQQTEGDDPTTVTSVVGGGRFSRQ